MSQHIPTRQLGRNGPTVSAIGLGTMGIGAFYGKTDPEEAFKALTYAADRGYTFWDTADIYGDSEESLAKWFTTTGRRSEIFLATKFGAREITDGSWTTAGGPISKPSYIKRAVERSLAHLQTDYIDLYYQHRVDPSVPIEIVLETLRPFVEKGQIKWLGLSECTPATLRRAKAVKGIGEKVIAVQLEYGPFELEVEKSGILDAIEETGVALVAYSPLSRGLVTGSFRSRADFEPNDLRLTLPRFSEENFPKNLALVDKFKAVGDKYSATASQIALAWILAEHPNFIPIPGSRSVARVEENASSSELKLSSEDVKAIRKLCEEADVQGGRQRPQLLTTGDCIELGEWKGE